MKVGFNDITSCDFFRIGFTTGSRRIAGSRGTAGRQFFLTARRRLLLGRRGLGGKLRKFPAGA